MAFGFRRPHRANMSCTCRIAPGSIVEFCPAPGSPGFGAGDGAGGCAGDPGDAGNCGIGAAPPLTETAKGCSGHSSGMPSSSPGNNETKLPFLTCFCRFAAHNSANHFGRASAPSFFAIALGESPDWTTYFRAVVTAPVSRSYTSHPGGIFHTFDAAGLPGFAASSSGTRSTCPVNFFAMPCGVSPGNAWYVPVPGSTPETSRATFTVPEARRNNRGSKFVTAGTSRTRASM